MVSRPPSFLLTKLMMGFKGLATIDRKGCRYINAYPQVLKKLQQSINLAKRERLGMFEFGDIEEEEY